MLFRCGKLHILTILQRSQFYIFDTNALEFFHAVSNRFHHASNLSILPFSQEYGEGSGCGTLYFCREHAFPEDLEGTGGELLEIGVLDATVYLDEIFLFVHVPRVHQVVRKPSVIGQKEQSRGILVETPYGKHPFLDVHDVHDSGIFQTGAGSYDTAGLVDLVIDEIGNFRYGLGSYNHFVDVGIDDLSDSRDFAIDGHESSGDELFRLSPG